MAYDIDEIILRLGRLYSHVQVSQLETKHAADDDGLWIVSAGGMEVQLESSSGNCPFLLESNAHAARYHLDTIDEAISVIERELNLQRAGAPK